MPNLKKNYEKYRDKGFEVVGVNIDEDPQMVQRFLALQPLPWTTVISADANARGFEHPLAVKCGIDAIPFLVLIGRDGKVSAIHVGGEKLEQKLAQMLGPAAPAAPTAPAEKPAVPPPGMSLSGTTKARPPWCSVSLAATSAKPAAASFSSVTMRSAQRCA